MSKNSLLLVLVAICLAATYVIFFSDWFRPKSLHIYHSNRKLHEGPARGNALPNLMFGMKPESRITDLKVVELSAFQTNKDALPVWHLVSDSNSIPLNHFYYGQYIAGMRPAIKGVNADALETNVTYRIFLSAGSLKGEHDFDVK
jgi:hypothetical protein